MYFADKLILMRAVGRQAEKCLAVV